MSTNSFFVAKQIQQDISIDMHIEQIEKQIQIYKQGVIEFEEEALNAFIPPEMKEEITIQCDILRKGINAHTIRLDTLKNIKNNQPVLQCDLDLLLLMPVFQIYEKYSHVASQTSEHKLTS